VCLTSLLLASNKESSVFLFHRLLTSIKQKDSGLFSIMVDAQAVSTAVSEDSLFIPVSGGDGMSCLLSLTSRSPGSSSIFLSSLMG
jgi:hypothetical protein